MQPSSPKPPAEFQPLSSPPQLTTSQQAVSRPSSQELLPSFAARSKSSFEEATDSTMRALIKDTNNPETLAGVKGNSYNLNQLEQAVKENNEIFLINGIISLAFILEELAGSTGLGLKPRKISGQAKPSPLTQ